MVLRNREVQSNAAEERWWPKLDWTDWVLFGLVSALLLGLSIVRSRSRLLWSDESFSFMLLRDPVLSHTLRGWWEGSDSGGLLYYLIGHVWFRIFGASPMTLRLLATTNFIMAIGIIWATARRVFVTPIVAVAIGLTFFLPSYLIWQEVNGRFYGLFLTTAAFASACTMYAVERRGWSTRMLVLLGCAHACLIGSHILGVVYSAGLLAALVVSDLLQQRRRWPLYGSVLLAWLVMIPLSYHSIHATAMIAQGVFWPQRPSSRDLVLGFFAYSRKLALFAILLFVIACVRQWRKWPTESLPPQSLIARRAFFVVACGLFLGQLAIFAKSRVGVSVYSDRYLLPLVIAMVLVFCAGLTRSLGPRLVHAVARPVPGLIVAGLCLVACFKLGTQSHTYDQLYAALDYPTKFEGRLPPGENVVFTYMPVFMMIRQFDPGHHYLFTTDWKYDGAIVGKDLSTERMVENVMRGGFAPHEVLDLPEIVREYPEFTLVAEPERLPWLEDRFVRGNGFAVTQVGTLSEWYPLTIWRIQCMHPATGCQLGPAPR